MGPGWDRTCHPWICRQTGIDLLPDTLQTVLHVPVLLQLSRRNIAFPLFMYYYKAVHNLAAGFLERGFICIKVWGVHFADFISFFINIP